MSVSDRSAAGGALESVGAQHIQGPYYARAISPTDYMSVRDWRRKRPLRLQMRGGASLLGHEAIDFDWGAWIV